MSNKEYTAEYEKFVPDVIPVDAENYQDKYLYWKSIEAIDYNVGIKNKPTAWWSIKFWHFTITATGSKVITGVWFTPTNLQIISTINGSTWPMKSIGLTDWTNMYNVYDYNTAGGMLSYYVTTSVVFIEDGSTGTFYNTTATITSFDSDWFTLDVTNKTLAWTMQCMYIAYG